MLAVANIIVRVVLFVPFSTDPNARTVNIALMILTCICAATAIGGVVLGLLFKSHLDRLARKTTKTFKGVDQNGVGLFQSDAAAKRRARDGADNFNYTKSSSPQGFGRDMKLHETELTFRGHSTAQHATGNSFPNVAFSNLNMV